MSPEPDTSPTAITDLLDGFFIAQVVMTCTHLKVYTKCADAPQDGPTLARRCEVDPAWMTLLLEANVALGLLVPTEVGYTPGPAAEAFLNEQRHGALTNTLKFALSDEIPPWTQLADIVRARTERPDLTAAVQTEPTRARAFAKASFNLFFLDALQCGTFTGVEHAVEIGNGLAPLGMALLRANESARLTVVDWPSFETPLFKTLRHAGYRERTTFLGGDPIVTVPQDGRADLVLLSGVLSHTPAAQRAALLHAAAKTLRPGGRLHAQDMVRREGEELTATLAQLRHAMHFGPAGLDPLEPNAVLALLDDAGFTDGALQPIAHSHATCITARRAG